MSDLETERFEVAGERGATAVNRMPSIQSRMSSILAIGLMTALGLGMLTWYYANVVTRPSAARRGAQRLATAHAQGDMPLPSLGRIDAPNPAPEFSAVAASPTAVTLQEIPLAPSPIASLAGAPQPKTEEQLTLERQLSGAVYAPRGAVPASFAASTAPPLPSTLASQEPGELAALLHPASIASVQAQVLPTQRLLLPKGAFIDCTLETAIDSTLPGMTTCVMATDTFGADGRIVLMERGTKLIGETRGQVQQGSTRVFVLWNEARTPAGVIVPLASPGADELGRSGLAGAVDNHFWERFGAAMLVSTIDGAVDAAVQSSRGGNGAVIVNPSATQGVMTEVLKNTIGIPPKVVKQQGDRIQVLVARDLDFRSVYELHSVAAHR